MIRGFEMLIIIPSPKDFIKTIYTLEEILNDYFTRSSKTKYSLKFLNEETRRLDRLYFEIKLPFSYIESDGSKEKNYGIIFNDYSRNLQTWVITTTGVEFSELLSPRSIICNKDKVQGGKESGELELVENPFLERNLKNFMSLVSHLINSTVDIWSMRFVEGELTREFPYACDFVYHKSSSYYIQDILDSSVFIERVSDEIQYFLKYRDVPSDIVKRLRFIPSDFISKFKEARRNRIYKIQDQVNELYEVWFSELTSEPYLHFKTNGIMLGNSDFSTIGPLQEFYDFLLSRLPELKL